MLARLHALHPFQTPEAQRLAVLFGIVYFAQGMAYLPDQTVTIVLKKRGLSASQVAGFHWIVTIPWLIKPVYGLVSDFLPLFGSRRRNYLFLTSGTAAAAAITLALLPLHPYWTLAALVTLFWLGIGFTDVLTDALMVENGKPLGLTGAFQSVQWGFINAALLVVGVGGGWLAERRALGGAFGLVACFPIIALLMAAFVVREARVRRDREAFLRTWAAIREALRERDVWIVTGFILFWTFSPSFGPAFLYYQTDLLHFSQQFIGFLASLGAGASIIGAFIYAPISRAWPLKRVINASIGVAVLSTLAYLVYRGPASAIAITVIFGCVGMVTQLSFLDLAAKSCPLRVEATFFALLMSIYNLGAKSSEYVGATLYEMLGYMPLVLISAGVTALTWLLVPLVRIDRIEAKAKQAQVPAS